MQTLTTVTTLTIKQQLKIDRFLLKAGSNMPFKLLEFFYKSFKNYNKNNLRRIEIDKLFSIDNESLKFLTDFTHKLEFMLPEERILTKGYIQNNYPLPEKESQFSEFMCRLFDYQFRIDELIRIFEFIDSFQEEIFSDPLSDEETKLTMFLCFKGNVREAKEKFCNYPELERRLIAKSQEKDLRTAVLKFYYVSVNKNLFKHYSEKVPYFAEAICHRLYRNKDFSYDMIISLELYLQGMSKFSSKDKKLEKVLKKNIVLKEKHMHFIKYLTGEKKMTKDEFIQKSYRIKDLVKVFTNGDLTKKAD